MENNGFEIHRRGYETWVGFAHLFCTGCRYENGLESGRLDKCHECIPTIDKYYKAKQPLRITKDEDGKNIASSITVK